MKNIGRKSTKITAIPNSYFLEYAPKFLSIHHAYFMGIFICEIVILIAQHALKLLKSSQDCPECRIRIDH